MKEHLYGLHLHVDVETRFTLQLGLQWWTPLLDTLSGLLVVAFTLVLLIIGLDGDEVLTIVDIECITVDNIDLIDI